MRLTIEVVGKTQEELADTLKHYIVPSVEAGNFVGFDRNTTGRYEFEVHGVPDGALLGRADDEADG